MADTYYIADAWCDLTNWWDADGRRYCKLAARGGMNEADRVMYPRPPQPNTVPPPPLTESGASAIHYDTIQDYLIAAQQAGQRIQTQNFFTATADGLDAEVSTGPNWLMLGLVGLGVVFVVKKVL